MFVINFDFGIPERKNKTNVENNTENILVNEKQNVMENNDENGTQIDSLDEGRLITNYEIDSVNIREGEIIESASENDNFPQVRILRNRDKLQAPDRYGESVTFIADAGPQAFKDAITGFESEMWEKAMEEEMGALKTNNTWTLIELPGRKRYITCRWLFTINKDSHDNPTGYEARLVKQGFSLREGIDYFETFALIVRYESIRVLLAIAAELDLEMFKFDVKTAFLYEGLDEDIYMEQPQGFVINSKRKLVCKLHKSLYGLKQSPRCWNKRFVAFLTFFKFTCINSDKCIFIGVVFGIVVILMLTTVF